jgi:hypothetical protein
MYTSHHIYLTEKLFKVHEPSNKVGGFLGDPFKKIGKTFGCHRILS